MLLIHSTFVLSVKLYKQQGQTLNSLIPNTSVTPNKGRESLSCFACSLANHLGSSLPENILENLLMQQTVPCQADRETSK